MLLAVILRRGVGPGEPFLRRAFGRVPRHRALDGVLDVGRPSEVGRIHVRQMLRLRIHRHWAIAEQQAGLTLLLREMLVDIDRALRPAE